MTPYEYVRAKYPNAGAQLSSMWGWQIMDYENQHTPVLLGRAKRSEADAWANAARKIRHSSTEGKKR